MLSIWTNYDNFVPIYLLEFLIQSAVSKQFEFKAQFPQKISIGSAIEFSLPQLSSFQLLGTIQVDANQNLSQLPNFYSRFEQADSIDWPIGAKQKKNAILCYLWWAFISSSQIIGTRIKIVKKELTSSKSITDSL